MARYQIYKDLEKVFLNDTEKDVLYVGDLEKNATGKWSFTRLGPPLIVFSKFNPHLEYVSEHDEVPGQIISGEPPSDIDGENAEKEDEWSHSRSPKQ